MAGGPDHGGRKPEAPQPISNRAFATSIGLMLAAALCLSLVALFAKQLTAATDLDAAIFLRFFAPFLVLAWIALVVADGGLRFGDWRLHALRSVFVLGAQYCLFFYLSRGSLLVGTLLFSTSGLFLPFITRVAFGMEIKRRTLLAIVLGFVGVAIVLKPTSGVNWAVLIGLLAGFFNAGSQAVTHRASKQIGTLAATTAVFGLCSLGALLVLAATGGVPGLARQMATAGRGDLSLLVVTFAFAVFTISNQTLRMKAFSYVNKPASLSPFYYTAIVFSGILDWWVYGVAPTWNVYLGTALILAGGLVMTRRQAPQAEPAPVSPA